MPMKGPEGSAMICRLRGEGREAFTKGQQALGRQVLQAAVVWNCGALC